MSLRLKDTLFMGLAIQSHHHSLLAGIFVYLQVHYDDRNAKEVTLIL
jgi:hypothetical protein